MATVLVVDDDFDMAEACAEVLRSEGHEVRVARNGEDGLAQIDGELPDLIICDVEMPVLDGPQMALQLFVHNVGREKIPIVLSSGVDNLKRVATRVGTPYFLAKPFTIEQLLALVSRAATERVSPTPHPY
jgi:CheY-like chemotaxis protein